VPSYGGMGAVMDAPVRDETERAEQDAKWRVAVTQAAMASAGDVHADLKAAIAATVTARADWREITRHFATQLAQLDYTWDAPNRRHIARGMYLPKLNGRKLGPALLVIDTSGSVPDRAVNSAIDDAVTILEECGLDRIEGVTLDTICGPVQSFERGDTVTVELHGRGGTHFAPVLDLIERADEPYSCVLWFTDLYPAEDWSRLREPSVPLLWIDYCDGNVIPPIGNDVVRMTP
jgi:predicted metal-dependent peptidase